MITDLDKYGLVALTIVVVLILFIAMNDMGDDSDLDLNGVYFTDSDSDNADEAALPDEDTVVVLNDPAEEIGSHGDGSRTDFDFMEEPVRYPGQPSNVPGGDPVLSGASQSSLTIHHVQKGDTLSLISKKFYGSTKWWKSIVDANPGLNPKNLAIGDRIRIPPLNGVAVHDARVDGTRGSGRYGTSGRTGTSDRSGTAGAHSHSKLSESGVKSRTYRVKKGDTLGKIAKTYYGNSGKWEKIYAANRRKISDPKRLQVGVELNIPR